MTGTKIPPGPPLPKGGSLAHQEADQLLEELGTIICQFKRMQAEAEAEVAGVQSRWHRFLAPLGNLILQKEQELEALEKGHREEFFGELESCRVELPHGALLYERTRPVVRRKTVTPEKLEAEGFPEAVKVVRSVDWDKLDTWPDARLWLVGTERRVKEIFNYEVKDGAQEERTGAAGKD